MNRIFFFIAILHFLSCSSDQNDEGLWPIQSSPKAGIKNTYTYHPPAGVVLPEKAFAYIFYKNDRYQYQKAVLSKHKNHFRFSLMVPKDVEVVVAGVFDKTGQLIDNHVGQGYVLPLHNEHGDRFDHIGIKTAEIMMTSARKILQMTVSRAAIITLFEENYGLHPNLQQERPYATYLNLLYIEKKEKVEHLLLEYAKEKEAQRDDEAKWMEALPIYTTLNKTKEKQQVENEILQIYPNGKLAAQQFMKEFYAVENRSEADILASMATFMARFEDHPAYSQDDFLLPLMDLFLEERNQQKMSIYESAIKHKKLLADSYNYAAEQILETANVAYSTLLKS
ncbi:MAG: hypothetical protein R2828_21145 [Saprospiraceae bacterium]